MTRVAGTSAVGAAALLSLLGLLGGGCGLFESDRPKPTPLESVTAQIAGRQVWSAKLDRINFVMAPTVRDGIFIVADDTGAVVALQADDGREAWRAKVDAPLAAGVGSDGRFTAVVTRGNELVVLEAGAVTWRTRLPARVSTAPLVAGERVFVMGVDRVAYAFDAIDGRKLWTLQRPGDALTLSQSGVVAAFKDTLLVGQGPRLAGVDPLRGTVRFEVPIATPRGTNEVERLADLVGPAARVGDRVCARAFQSAVGCADAERGTLIWSKNVGGAQTVAADADFVIGADASDRVTAWKAGSGELAWTNEKLLYRGLSGAVLVGRTVVFGDVEGQVHFLDRSSGQTLLRLPTDGSAVVGTPALSGSTILVATKNGGLFGFRPE